MYLADCFASGIGSYGEWQERVRKWKAREAAKRHYEKLKHQPVKFARRKLQWKAAAAARKQK